MSSCILEIKFQKTKKKIFFLTFLSMYACHKCKLSTALLILKGIFSNFSNFIPFVFPFFSFFLFFLNHLKYSVVCAALEFYAVAKLLLLPYKYNRITCNKFLNKKLFYGHFILFFLSLFWRDKNQEGF